MPISSLMQVSPRPRGCCCLLLGWERGWSLSPPLLDRLSPGLGWRVGSPSASSAECLPRSRRSQQSRRQPQVLFPRGPLERSLKEDLAAGRPSTACPSSQLILPLASCCQSLPHVHEQANLCPAARCLSCSPPLETCRPGCPEGEGRCCPQRCQSLPVPGVAVSPSLQTRLPMPPTLPLLARAALATWASLAPTLQAAARPPGGDGKAAEGRISLCSWNGCHSGLTRVAAPCLSWSVGRALPLTDRGLWGHSRLLANTAVTKALHCEQPRKDLGISHSPWARRKCFVTTQGARKS